MITHAQKLDRMLWTCLGKDMPIYFRAVYWQLMELKDKQ